ncbi:MAG: restriction endonuclease [Candidatus Neptunochlamydia sp.]|nr:restriction endonuclease [Candidatus Neptunochlamydia sp.]
MKDVVGILSDERDLSEKARQEMLSSGQRAISNRINWARTYLVKTHLLFSPRRGVIDIIEEGRKVLNEKPPHIDVQFLEKFPSFIEFRNTKKGKPKAVENDPDDQMSEIYKNHQALVKKDLMDTILSSSSKFFEKLIVDVLVNMGYGGTKGEVAQVLGKSGDEGIDGIINEDRLGLDKIYIQAKRWNPQQSIDRPEVQKFVGTLVGENARKGVFITTSTFTKEAKEYAKNQSVALIDGDHLLDLL